MNGLQSEDAMTTEGQDSPEGGTADRRTGARQISVLINAGIVHRGDDALCRIRNLSAGGVMIECPLPLAVDDPVELHLRSGSHVRGTVRWAKEGQAGVAFDDPASAALVGATQQPAPKRVSIRRQPESASPIGHPVFRRNCWAHLSAGNMKGRTPVLQISPAGIIVENCVEWGGERLFSVTIEGLGRYSARLDNPLCVEDAETAALIFVEPVLYRTFNEWLIATPRRAENEPAVLPEGAVARPEGTVRADWI